jgi:predicted Zn-dependent peptidase
MLVTWDTGRPGVTVEELEAGLHEETMALASADQRDVERAVHLMETAELSMLQQVGERADQLSMFASLFDDPGRINTELDRIRAVRPEDVRAFAEAYLVPSNRGVLTYVPAEGS